MSRFPPPCSHIWDQFRLPSTMSKERRYHFNADPVAEVTLHPIPRVLNLLTRPVSWSDNTPSPPPEILAATELLAPLALSPPLLHPVTNPASTAQPYIPPPTLSPGVHLHPAIIAPNLQYDVRFLPTHPVQSAPLASHSFSSPPLTHHCPISGFVRVIPPGYSTLPPTPPSRLGKPTSQFRTSCSPSTTTSARM